MSAEQTEEFWDERANENALYFIDSRLDYNAPDEVAFWEGGRGDLSRIVDLLGVELEGSEEVVEIGCGVGRITRALAERGASVRALDVSSRMLELAREHNPDASAISWVHGDGCSLAGIDEASADVCFSHVGFQHIPDPQVTLGYVAEICRVLRPGGWAAFQISNKPEIHRRRSALSRLRSAPARVLGRAPRGEAHPAWLGSAVGLGDLATVAEAGGARIDRTEGEGTQFCLVLLRKQGSEA